MGKRETERSTEWVDVRRFLLLVDVRCSREYLIVISFILQHRLTHRQNTQIHIHFRSVHDIAAKPEALIFISVRGNENIVRDEENENEKWDESCDKMWRWLYNTCKSNHPERQNKRIKRDRREIQLWIWFQMRMFLAKKYILTTESVIMANRQTHRILFVGSYGYESRKNRTRDMLSCV